MSRYELLQVGENGGIVTVRLHRPDARNALSRQLMGELTDFARATRTRADVRAVVLLGGRQFFSAGADLGEAMANDNRQSSLLELREAVMIGPDMCRAWEEIEAVTIMGIEGYCVGGACALALHCDFRVMGEAAMMRLPEVPLGMNMSWRSLPRLAALIGPARAKRFVMFGDATPAKTLLDWGLADDVVPDGTVDAAALRWAERVAALPPLPVRMTKEAINAAANAQAHATSYMDRDQFLLTLGTADLKEGVSAFFEKRPPRFEGR